MAYLLGANGFIAAKNLGFVASRQPVPEGRAEVEAAMQRVFSVETLDHEVQAADDESSE